MALNVAHFGYVLEVGKVRFHDEAARLARSDASARSTSASSEARRERSSHRHVRIECQ
jgi:hypothetical protein